MLKKARNEEEQYNEKMNIKTTVKPCTLDHIDKDHILIGGVPKATKTLMQLKLMIFLTG